MPAVCDVDADLNVAEAVGRPIDDDLARQFVYLVSRATTRTLEHAATTATTSELAARLRELAKRRCSGAVPTVVARAYALAVEGRTDLDLDAAGSTRLADDLTTAASAIESRSSIGDSDLAAALTPFGITPASLTAPPVPVPTGCESNAEVVDKREPVFPQEHLSRGQRVIVSIATHLSGDGQPVFVRLYRITGARASSGYVDSTLLAAANSTYRSAREACRPVAKTYLFHAEYAF